MQNRRVSFTFATSCHSLFGKTSTVLRHAGVTSCWCYVILARAQLILRRSLLHVVAEITEDFTSWLNSHTNEHTDE